MTSRDSLPGGVPTGSGDAGDERAATERELRHAVERYRLVGLASNEALWDFDPITYDVKWNDGLTRVFGHPPEEVGTGLGWWAKCVHPDDRPRVAASFDAFMAGTADYWSEEYRFRRGDGSYASVLDRGYALRENGELVRVFGSIIDATATRTTAETLRFLSAASSLLSETLDYQTTVEQVARVAIGALAECCLVFLFDEHGELEHVGAASGDAAHAEALRVIADRSRPLLAGGVAAAVLRTDEPVPIENAADELISHLAPDEALAGAYRSIGAHNGYLVPLRTRGRYLGAIVLLGTTGDRPFDAHAQRLALDLAQRAANSVENARLYRAAQLAEARYRQLFEHIPLPLFVVDTATLEILASNPAAATKYGCTADELRSLTFDALHADGDSDAAGQALRGSTDAAGLPRVWEHRTRPGQLFEVEISTHPLSYAARDARVVLVSDVSERIRAQRALQDSEEQLRQAQKMEAVGRLAGGVAHDFNNLLTAIQGHAELLIGELPDGHAMAEDLEEIRRAAERATSLTRQLLAFSRRQVLQPRPLNLNAVVADMGKMLGRLIGDHITVESELHPALPAVHADPVQIQQVVLNLVLNARDAMGDGGTLRIRTLPASAATPGAPAELGARAWVLLSIEDEGHGIPPELLPNIFEPFFTTKEAGRGTGLGLSTVYGIVRQTGGHVTVRSTTSGATFGVWLPASGQAPAATAAPERRAPGHVARILLVEDEAAVRVLARRILQRAGYEVLEAASAREGLDLAHAHAGSIDLLLTDMVMPELSGRELAEELATRFPRLPVLFMSGYTEDVILRNGVHQRSMAFLEKPFSPQALLDKVRTMLETAADAPADRSAAD